MLTDFNVLIGGFILGGSSEGTRVVVRALGPSLEGAGIDNALQNPTVDLRDSNGAPLVFNDNWRDDPAQAAELIALDVAPQSDLEAAIVRTMPSGTYTAIVVGKDGGIGIGLVELYNLN